MTVTSMVSRSPDAPRARVGGWLFDPKQLWRSAPGALRKLNPATLWRNPVMFIVEVGAAFTTVLSIADPTVFAWVITVWLWLTVLFANRPYKISGRALAWQRPASRVGDRGSRSC